MFLLVQRQLLLQCWLFCSLLGTSLLGYGAEKHLYLRDVDEIFEEKSVQALARAAASGDVRKIDKLVNEQGVPVDAHGYLGVTPLWWPLQRQNLKGFQKLLELGADPNYQWADGNSIMNQVVIVKSPEYLRLALAHGGNPNLVRRYKGVKDTPIYQALIGSPGNDPTEMVKLLINAGADVNYDSWGLTPVMSAAGFRLFEVLLLMLERGGDYMRVAPSGEVYTLVSIQSSLENQTLTPEKEKYRRQVVEFLEARGVNLADYSRK